MNRGDEASAKRLLQHYRTEWERLRVDNKATAARRVLGQAVALCGSCALTLPEWLASAVVEDLCPETDAQRQGSDDTQRAIRRLGVLLDVMGGTPEAEERHYRDATDRLNADGDPISAAGIKKLWQREKDVFLISRSRGRSKGE